MNAGLRPRVAIVRGPYLNPFEMQTYVPLLSQFDLTAFATHDALYDISETELPVRRLHRPKEIGFDIPRWRGLCNTAARLLCGSEDRMLGLEQALAGFNLVHVVETYNYFSLQAVQAKATSGVPVVVTVWDNIAHNRDDVPRYARCKAAVLRLADLFLAVTDQAKAMLMAEGVDEKRIRVVGAGVNVERFRPEAVQGRCRQQYGLLDSERVILFIGSLIESKGVYDLLKAIKLMRSAGILQPGRHRVLYIGQGAESSRLRAQTREWGLHQIVTFGGSASYAEMPDIHRMADIFVLPSIPTPTWEEQFGMVLAESMATGKAVVSTRSGSIPEVVGEAGVLVPSGDPESLAQSLSDLLDNEELREDLGRRARKRVVSLYAHQVVAGKIADAYRTILGRA